MNDQPRLSDGRRPDLLPDAVLRYADHQDGLLDVHLPRPTYATARTRGHQQPRPAGADGPVRRVVVLLHGGFWKTAYDRRHTRPMARALNEAGFCVVTPEYRRVGPGGSGGWPRTAQDVRRAVDRLPELLAGIDLDLSPGQTELQVIGHSAGGQLALWLTSALMADRRDDALPLARTVALAPVCDLRQAIRRGLGADAAAAFLGEDPDRALAEADPLTLLDRRPPGAVHVIHGTGDEVVPVELSHGLVERHPWVQLTELPVGHFELIEPAEPAFGAVVEALRSATGPSSRRDGDRHDGDRRDGDRHDWAG
ncbi:MAG TPA: alpha/beta hydrolase [Marmoricola sp.]|nr:alpha/beta hydrolase [Marmoricola sp.]